MAQGKLTPRARPGKAAHVAELQIAWSMMRVRVPCKEPGSAQAPALEASVMRVWEQEDDRLEWVLLATWPVRSAQDAWQCVGEYRLRWTIEEYYKCLKIGWRGVPAEPRDARRMRERFFKGHSPTENGR